MFSGISTARRDGDITGRAKVIDGDTIEIHGRRVRLFRVDAPEAEQICFLDGKSYRCGQEAASALAGEISHRTIQCQQRDLDPYNRIVAICYLGNENLNEWLVSQGLALAYYRYSCTYVLAELGTPWNQSGLWHRHSRDDSCMSPHHKSWVLAALAFPDDWGQRIQQAADREVVILQLKIDRISQQPAKEGIDIASYRPPSFRAHIATSIP